MEAKIKRILKGWSQSMLSEKANVSRFTILKIEKGNIDTVSLGVLKKIAKALDTTVQELFFSNEE